MQSGTVGDIPNGQLIADMEVASSKALGVMVGNLSGQTKVWETPLQCCLCHKLLLAQTDFIQTELPELVFRVLSEPSGPEPEAVTISAFLKDTLKLVVWYLDRTDESVPMSLLHILNQIFLGDTECQKFFCSSSHGLLGSSASASQYNGQWFKLPAGGASRFWISTANSFALHGGYPAVCKRLLRTDVPPVPLAEVNLYLTSILQKSEYTCTESFRDEELKELLHALFVRCIHSMETDSLDSEHCPPVATGKRLVAAADSVLKACDKRYGSWAKGKRRLYTQWKLMLLLAMLQHGTAAVVQGAVRDLRAVCSAASGDAAMTQFCLQWLDSQNVVVRMLSALERLTSGEGGPPSLSAGGGVDLDSESTLDSEDDEGDDDVPPTEAPTTPQAEQESLADAAAAAGPAAMAALLDGGHAGVALLPSEKAWLGTAVLAAGESKQIAPAQCRQFAELLGKIVSSRELAALQQQPELLGSCILGLQAMTPAQHVRLVYSTEDELSPELDCIVGAAADTLADFAQGGLLQWRHVQQLASAHRTCDSNGMHGVLKVICTEVEAELQPLLGKEQALAVMLAVRLGGDIPQRGDLSGKAQSSSAEQGDGSSSIGGLRVLLEDLGSQMTEIRSLVAGGVAPPLPEAAGGAAAAKADLPSAATPTSVTSAPPVPPNPAAWLSLAAQELNLSHAQAQSLSDFAAFLASQGKEGQQAGTEES